MNECAYVCMHHVLPSEEEEEEFDDTMPFAISSRTLTATRSFSSCPSTAINPALDDNAAGLYSFNEWNSGVKLLRRPIDINLTLSYSLTTAVGWDWGNDSTSTFDLSADTCSLNECSKRLSDFWLSVILSTLPVEMSIHTCCVCMWLLKDFFLLWYSVDDCR